MHFRLVAPAAIQASPLWRLWLADAKRFKGRAPCDNENAIGYVGTFTFFNGGSFIGCSQKRPYQLDGYFALKTPPYYYSDDETNATMTRGVFSAYASPNNIVELVFSDAHHRNYSQPEVVLGPSPIGR